MAHYIQRRRQAHAPSGQSRGWQLVSPPTVFY